MGLMRDCQDITKDIDQSTFERLKLIDRLAIRAHNSICKPCRHYFKDSKIIDRVLRRKYRHLREYSFSIEEKQQIKDKLS